MARDRDRNHESTPISQISLEDAAQALRSFSHVTRAFARIEELIAAGRSAEELRRHAEQTAEQNHAAVAASATARAKAEEALKQTTALLEERTRQLAALTQETEQAGKEHAAHVKRLAAELEQRTHAHRDALAAADERHRQDLLALEADRDHVREEIRLAKHELGMIRDKLGALA